MIYQILKFENPKFENPGVFAVAPAGGVGKQTERFDSKNLPYPVPIIVLISDTLVYMSLFDCNYSIDNSLRLGDKQTITIKQVTFYLICPELILFNLFSLVTIVLTTVYNYL